MNVEGKQKKILLLVDDEINLQQLLKVALTANHYEVETALNGIEALAKLEVIKPDLILLDINMPKMGGLEFYQRICDTNNHPKYPILVLTARAHIEETLKQLDLVAHMSKPFEIADLLREINDFLHKN